MFCSPTPSLPFFLYALLIVILTSTDPGHLHMPNSTVLQYTNCAALHTRLQHGADLENEFCLTINLNLTFCCYNSNKHRHTILSKSQHYKTPAATHFRPHRSIIRKHTTVQTFVRSCLLVAVRTKTPHYLTFNVRHLVQSSCPRYGVYLRQHFKKFSKRRVSRWSICIEGDARDSNATPTGCGSILLVNF